MMHAPLTAIRRAGSDANKSRDTLRQFSHFVHWLSWRGMFDQARNVDHTITHPLESHKLRHCQLFAALLWLENLYDSHPKDG